MGASHSEQSMKTVADKILARPKNRKETTIQDILTATAIRARAVRTKDGIIRVKPVKKKAAAAKAASARRRKTGS